ncbi:ATP-binding protein [Massilia putida]|uniref:ATP-binding protein n=1 Tax=Massilia putida TaxID=1141883 RepID=UPI000951C29B|nr:ATP-binding protein [Massilia putida]
MAAPRRVDLQNCADEPIHIPGSIQPHGALIFLSDAGLVEGWSANIAAVTGREPALGQPFGALGLPDAVTELIQECSATMIAGEGPAMVAAVTIDGRDYDCVVHAHVHRILVEFEVRDVGMDEVAQFAIKAHSSIDRLRRQRTVDGLLETAVRQVREFTGFDRVMAYRFRSDDSGDIAAEARRDDLVPYLGQRYPAGDIPPQARRLYVLNTLRMIADVGYRPVSLLGAAREGAPDSEPLDMSFAVLRSVSPIHVEYLQNMGVAASMSVSIVVGDRLWGLIACHHMTPKRVPYSVRMAADVLAQVIASTVQGIEAREDAALVEHAAQVRTSLVESLLLEEDPLEALVQHGDGLLESAHAQALIVGQYGRVVCRGIDRALGEAVAAALPADANDILTYGCVKEWPDAVRPLLGKWAGLLGLPFDPPTDGWCVLLRTEQVEEVAWGGKPDKSMSGPMGERLTPRGSFDAWHETVRGRAHPWEDGILTHARMMLGELTRVSNARRAQTEATRAQLLAMLGHDLRDPLNSINMAGMVLERTDGGSNKGTLGKRIQSSSNRMQRMIGQVLDMSRIDRGLSLGIDLQPVDLAALACDMVEEARLAYPTIVYDVHATGPAFVLADSGRLGQVISNLLSNARQHGEPNHPIVIRLAPQDGQAVLDVANAGSPIAPETEATLFNPFKRGSLNNPRNRTGMGLGLYIAQQIVREHKGEIAYRHENGNVVFSVRLPLAPRQAS